MLTIKTTIEKYSGVEVEDYINVPVIDRVTARIDLTAGTIHANDTTKAIGVITNAKDLGNGEVELTIALWKNKFQGEYLSGAYGKITPLSYSMGFQNDEGRDNNGKVS